MNSVGQIVALRKPATDVDRTAREDAYPARPSAHDSGRRPDLISAVNSLDLKDVSRCYGSIRAVDSVSLSVGQGEIIALVGHSGSGKSTLLRLIAGLEHQDTGRITIAGRDMSGPASFVPPERRGVGMMFQDYALFPHLSVLKNVLFGLRAHPHAEAVELARKALDSVDLLDRANDYPHMLSGGQQQRVALARALVPRPAVLLMDEPFSNLDRRTHDVIRDDTIAVLRANDTTAVLVTHDPDDAMRVADRILMMQAGRVIQSGQAEDFYKRPVSLDVARFFSELNEIEAICRDGIASTALGDIPVGPIGRSGRATVCIRPQGLRLLEPTADRPLARVLSGQYLGDTILVHLAVEGLERPLYSIVPDGEAPPPGKMVGIAADPDDLLVFPAD